MHLLLLSNTNNMRNINHGHRLLFTIRWQICQCLGTCTAWICEGFISCLLVEFVLITECPKSSARGYGAGGSCPLQKNYPLGRPVTCLSYAYHVGMSYTFIRTLSTSHSQLTRIYLIIGIVILLYKAMANVMVYGAEFNPHISVTVS